MTEQVLLRGGRVLDVTTGEHTVQDLGVRDGIVVEPGLVHGAPEVDLDGRTVMFGLWDNHAHSGYRSHDPYAVGYFDSIAGRTVHAGENMLMAAGMGVTGLRTLGEAADIDIHWGRAFASGTTLGPRVVPGSNALRTTGGHGTAFPRFHAHMEQEKVVDGPVEMTRAVRELNEHGAKWVKLLLTGGLYSPHESVDHVQFTDEELVAVMAAAENRGLMAAAHCGGPRTAERFVELGGRSIEHGYALDEQAAETLARRGAWLVPTISVTHDEAMMYETGWPQFAIDRALEVAKVHAQSLQLCLAAGVRIATGADLNPHGTRLHRELELLEQVGMTRLQVLEAATVSSRALNKVGEHTRPEPGAAADLLFVGGDPLEDMRLLRSPDGVMAYGRFLYHPTDPTPRRPSAITE